MVTGFDKDTIIRLRQEIDAALDEVAKRNGIALKMGNIRYTDTTFSGKVDAAVVDKFVPAADPRLAKYAQDYRRYAAIYNLPITLLQGGTMVYGGKRYTVLGYNTRAKGYPIVARNMADEKVYKLPITAVTGK